MVDGLIITHVVIAITLVHILVHFVSRCTCSRISFEPVKIAAVETPVNFFCGELGSRIDEFLWLSRSTFQTRIRYVCTSSVFCSETHPSTERVGKQIFSHFLRHHPSA